MKRVVLFKTILMLLISVVFAFGLLSNAQADYKTFPVPTECLEQAKKEGVLHIYDWAEWWPEKIFTEFSKEYGIKISRDHYASYDEMVTKFKLNPKIPYDLVLGVSPDTFYRLKGVGILGELKHEWIPNVNEYMEESVKKLPYDAGYKYTVPTSIYFTSYLYNSKYVDPDDARIPSFKLLFEGQEYSGRITMLDNWYEGIGCTLKYLGYSYNTVNEEELMQAKEVLLRQKPLIMAYDSWPRRLIIEEEAWISQLWSGDSYHLHEEIETVKGALPPEGTYMGTDLCVVPKGAKNTAAAHLFLNYIFRTEVNATLIKTIAYSPVHKNVLGLIPDDMKNWPGFKPSDDYIQKCEMADPMALSGRGKEIRTKIWEDLKKE